VLALAWLVSFLLLLSLVVVNERVNNNIFVGSAVYTILNDPTPLSVL
jgi:hypothetical protein